MVICTRDKHPNLSAKLHVFIGFIKLTLQDFQDCKYAQWKSRLRVLFRCFADRASQYNVSD